MSLVVSSTTDTQEAVNAAAGVEDAAPAPPPETTETEDAPAKPAPAGDEPDEQDDTGDPEEQPEPQPRRKGGFQRKIERLEAQNDFAMRRVQALESELAGRQPAATRPPADPEPQEAQFQDPMEYHRALMRWETRQEIRAHDAAMQRQMGEWQAQEQDRQRSERWQTNVGAFRREAPDYDEALQSVDHIRLHKDLQQAIMESEDGARLAYELARQPDELQRIASLTPLAAVRELGKFEASIAKPPAVKKQAVSQAPQPIRPVGNGATPSTVPMDQLSYQDYKRRREREIRARREGR